MSNIGQASLPALREIGMHRQGLHQRPLPRSTLVWKAWHGQLRSLRGSTQAVQSAVPATDHSATLSNASDKLRRAQKTDGLNPQEFQLPLAVSLGASSFECYSSPAEMHGIKDVGADGTETIYMCREFLRDQVEGILQVHLRRAEGLQPVDEACHPVCLVQVAESVGITQRQVHAPNPQWDQTFFLYVRNRQPLAEQNLKVEVWHQTKDKNCVVKQKTKRHQEQAGLASSRQQPQQHPEASEDGQSHADSEASREGSQAGSKQPLQGKDQDYQWGVASQESREWANLLGQAEVALQDICDGELHEVELTLSIQGSQKTFGAVQLSCQYLTMDNKDDLLDAAAYQWEQQDVADSWRSMRHHLTHWWSREQDEWRSEAVERQALPPEGAFHDGASHKEVLAALGEDPERAPWKSWASLREQVIERQLAKQFTPTAFVQNRDADTELWMYRNKEDREAVVAFRGTESPKDMLTDMNLDLMEFNIPGHDRQSKAPNQVAEEMDMAKLKEGPLGPLFNMLETVDNASLKGIDFKNFSRFKLPDFGGRGSKKGKKRQASQQTSRKPPQKGSLSAWARIQALLLYSSEHDHIWCHKGFLQAYLAVHERVMCLLEEITDDGSGQPWKIYLTGHSMGGALATLCAYEVACQQQHKRLQHQVSMISFGQPRVGNVPFAEDYDRMVPHSWRVRNANDIVTKVPGMLGYKHVGMEVVMLPDGTACICKQSSDEIREGQFLDTFVEKLQNGTAGKDAETKEKFEALVKDELATWTSIVKGVAIKEHMEDLYHDILKELVSKAGEDLDVEKIIRDLDVSVSEAIEDAVQKVEKRRQGTQKESSS